MEIKFNLKKDFIELNKLLKAMGLCATGGMTKIVIDEGLVKVDGKTEFRKRCKIKKGQRIDFDGYIIDIE